jgi:hypothetical protein
MATGTGARNIRSDSVTYDLCALTDMAGMSMQATDAVLSSPSGSTSFGAAPPPPRSSASRAITCQGQTKSQALYWLLALSGPPRGGHRCRSPKRRDRTMDNVQNMIVISIYHSHKPIDSINLLGSGRKRNVFPLMYGQTCRVESSFK